MINLSSSCSSFDGFNNEPTKAVPVTDVVPDAVDVVVDVVRVPDEVTEEVEVVHGRVACIVVNGMLSFTEQYGSGKAKIYTKINHMNQMGCAYILNYGGGLVQGKYVF